MKSMVCGLILFSIFFQAAEAQQKPISVRESMALAAGLQNLDGHMVIVEQNGTKGTIMQPWEFRNGDLRRRIARDLDLVQRANKVADDARLRILKEAGNPKPGTPENAEAERQFQEVLNGPADGTEALSRIKYSELKLDINEIPGTVLSALKPVLDGD